MTTPLQLRLVGTPALLLPGGGERLLDRHGALIAARLALAGPQARGLRAGLLWPDVTPARARANLRQRLLRLRDLAGCAWIVGERTLSLAPGVHCDGLDAAVQSLPAPMLHAELLEGVDAPESDTLADWLAQARAQRRGALLQGLAEQARPAQAQNRLDAALAWVQQSLVMEPHAEEHHRALMQLHYLGHDTTRALAAYRHLQQLLAREFGAQPSAATQALAQLLGSASRPVSVPAPTGSVALSRPPVLAGRQADLAQMHRARDEGGALWLWGEAGIGKSRLLAEATQGLPHALHVRAHPGDAGLPWALLSRCTYSRGSEAGRSQVRPAVRARVVLR